MNKYISKEEQKNLSRNVYAMPGYIDEALKLNDLEVAYRSRPAYQKNDYIGWISRARRQETQAKRLQQMIEELKDGTKYMKMDYKPSN